MRHLIFFVALIEAVGNAGERRKYICVKNVTAIMIAFICYYNPIDIQS